MTSINKVSQPMTRQQLANQMGICSKTLYRFILKHSIKMEARALIKPKVIQEILQKFHEMD